MEERLKYHYHPFVLSTNPLKKFVIFTISSDLVKRGKKKRKEEKKRKWVLKIYPANVCFISIKIRTLE